MAWTNFLDIFDGNPSDPAGWGTPTSTQITHNNSGTSANGNIELNATYDDGGHAIYGGAGFVVVDIRVTRNTAVSAECSVIITNSSAPSFSDTFSGSGGEQKTGTFRLYPGLVGATTFNQPFSTGDDEFTIELDLPEVAPFWEDETKTIEELVVT
jgi:hypothetical protein